MNPGKIPIPRKQVEAEIDLFNAKIRIQRAILEASMERSIRERRLVEEFCKAQGFGTTMVGIQHVVLREYLSAKQAEDKAQEDAQRVNLKELESQVQIREAMLAQAENKIASPGGFKV
jgi:hypothetical protein